MSVCMLGTLVSCAKTDQLIRADSFGFKNHYSMRVQIHCGIGYILRGFWPGKSNEPARDKVGDCLLHIVLQGGHLLFDTGLRTRLPLLKLKNYSAP